MLNIFSIFLICLLYVGSQARATQPHELTPEDKFTAAWQKSQALLEARIDENVRTIKRFQENFEDEIQYWVPRKQRKNAQQIATLNKDFQQELINNLQAEISLFEGWKNSNLTIFSPSVDNFLCLLYSDSCQLKRDEKMRSLNPIAEVNTLVKDDISCFRSIIKKLSPYQFGAFRYVEAVTERSQDGKLVIDTKKFTKIVTDNLECFLNIINEKIQNTNVQDYITDNINSQFANFQQKLPNLLKQLDNLLKSHVSADVILLQINEIAFECAKIDFKYKCFLNPQMLAQLEKDHPDEAAEQNTTISEPEPPVQPIIETNQVPEQSSNHTQQAAPEEMPASSSASTTSTTVLERKITALDLKKQRRAERKAQQKRAKEWSHQLYKDHLSQANLTTNQELISEFEWMNELIDPLITMTYKSIEGKLGNLTKIKNGAGSRRHFVITDAPIGRPVACFFHAPHPDQAVRNERWRLSISEALKKAGYFQNK
jgi:hypothetical protein